jgi:hypothetical protein
MTIKLSDIRQNVWSEGSGKKKHDNYSKLEASIRIDVPNWQANHQYMWILNFYDWMLKIPSASPTMKQWNPTRPLSSSKITVQDPFPGSILNLGGAYRFMRLNPDFIRLLLKKKAPQTVVRSSARSPMLRWRVLDFKRFRSHVSKFTPLKHG